MTQKPVEKSEVKEMKKLLFIFLITTLFFLSCDMMFMDKAETAHIEKKTTIEPFDHLNDPIVITMPVYKNNYFLGIEADWTNRIDYIGDIFVVLDIEHEVVHDWIFFPGNHGYTNWRCVEVGQNPTIYCSVGSSSGLVGCLNPQKTTLDVYNANTVGGVADSLNDTLGNYIFIDGYAYNQEWEMPSIKATLFNCTTGEITGKIEFPCTSPGYFDHPITDKEGNFWQTALVKETVSLLKINVNDTSIETITTFPLISSEYEDQMDYYTVQKVTDDKIFLSRTPLGIGSENEAVVIVDKNNVNDVQTISMPNTKINTDFHIYKIIEVDGEFYTVSPDSDFSKKVMFAKIDRENNELRPLDVVLENIDMTETVYVRGTRVYLMSSRNISNIYYMYYDFATGEIGEKVYVSFNDVVKQK